MSESTGENKIVEVYWVLIHLQLFDLKQELVNNTYKLKIVDKNVNTIAVNLKKNEIVSKEIISLPDNLKIYDRCGRM